LAPTFYSADSSGGGNDMAELVPEQNEHVQNLITQFMEKTGLDRSEAIKQIHLFVCKGACSWYKNSGGPGTGFDAEGQTQDQRQEIEKLMDQVAVEHNVTRKDLMKWFHVFRCHS
jgi:glucuronate isomerase